MNKFAVGQRVKRINYGHGNFSVGQEGVVKRISPSSKRVELEGDKPDHMHDPDNLVAVVETSEPLAIQFKVGDKVRRRTGHGTNAGVKEGEVFEVQEVRPNGWVFGPMIGAGHNPAYLELVPQAASAPYEFKVGDRVERVTTVTSTYVAAGSFKSAATYAQLNWAESDDEQLIEISVYEQECNAKDLREFAAVLIELADKLDATKR